MYICTSSVTYNNYEPGLLPERFNLIIISAMTSNRVIGNNNGLPWNIPEEYEQFLNHVRGQAVIFGRKSYEIFGRDLPDSELFVVSRSTTSIHGAQTCRSIEQAADLARQTGKQVFSERITPLEPN